MSFYLGYRISHGLPCDLCAAPTPHRAKADGSLFPLCFPHGGLAPDQFSNATLARWRYWQRIERRAHGELITTWTFPGANPRDFRRIDVQATR